LSDTKPSCMKKLIVGLLMVLAAQQASAQFDYKQNNDIDVPVLGWQTGLVGGGFTAMLPNRDDLDADTRLDIETINFSYAAGLERIYWFQPSIGFGGQLLYWVGGSAYKGDDTISKIQLAGKSTMNYAKLPIMFHYKSFNRYYPNRKVRFTASFGPYIAYLTSFKDVFTYTKTSDKNFKQEIAVDGNNYSATVKIGSNTSTLKGSLSGLIYNPIDVGMCFAVGGEVRVTRKSVLVLQARIDIGFSNVENTRLLTFVEDGKTTEINFSAWDGFYAKYTNPNLADIALGFQPNRPATKNVSAGGFLSYRYYF
jgi:hypothetical protein